jgi:hypothetical protein
MSAFIPNTEHIGFLAATLAERVPMHTPAAYATMLANEVIDSVAFRYPRDIGNGDLPGPNLTDDQIIKESVVYAEYYSKEGPVLNDLDIKNMVSCYMYQACEHPEWETSETLQRLADLNRQLDVAGLLENVRWGFSEPNVPPVVLALYEDI